MISVVAKRQHSRRGSTLLELIVSTVLVGVLMTAALSSTGQSLLTQRKEADRVIAQHLAQSLLAEVQTKAFEEPDATLPLLGLDLGETLGLKTGYDDVDDFDGYNESPPKSANGATMAQYAGWSRRVDIAWLNAVTLLPTGSTNSPIKRIKITVRYNGVEVYSAYGHKTSKPPSP